MTVSPQRGVQEDLEPQGARQRDHRRCCRADRLVRLALLLPDALFRVAAFQILAGYFAFQMVVVASLRARVMGWIPGGQWSLGKWGWPVGIGALVYGVLSMIVLARPNGDTHLAFFDRWIALIGFIVVAAVGLTYMAIAKPYRHSTAPEGDAIAIANLLREHAPNTTCRHSPRTCRWRAAD